MTVLKRVKSLARKAVARLSLDYGKDNEPQAIEPQAIEPQAIEPQAIESQDIVHQIGKLKIVLPHGHKLPIYQQQCPQYDRFLPHIAKYLPSNSFVVDVGANSADTLAGMINANPSLNFLCIEADDYFYQYLTSNVSEIQKIYSNSIIKTVKALAGFEISNVAMVGTGGTKKQLHLRGIAQQHSRLNHWIASFNRRILITHPFLLLKLILMVMIMM